MSPTLPHPVRVLFVCRYNRTRSATAERIFCKDPALDVRSAGTSEDALVRVNARMMEWADIIFVMDGDLRRWMTGEFAGHGGLSKLVCLDIEDEYRFLQPELIQLLTDRTVPHLERFKAGPSSAGEH